MLSGELPDWPYEWPPPGHERLRRRVHPELVTFLRRAIQVDQRKRFRDAGHMLASFARIRGHALGRRPARKRRTERRREASWKTIRHKEFKRRFGSSLGVRAQCSRCAGPMAEPMLACPWCGRDHSVYRGETAFPRRCPRCRRGMKADWRFCAWCYGPGFEPETSRRFGDARYTARCPNPRCDRRELMPFMRYCPWCRTKVRRRWKVPDKSSACARCGWGVLREYWSFCPWCGERQRTE
jgi:hypothetical protein